MSIVYQCDISAFLVLATIGGSYNKTAKCLFSNTLHHKSWPPCTHHQIKNGSKKNKRWHKIRIVQTFIIRAKPVSSEGHDVWGCGLSALRHSGVKSWVLDQRYCSWLRRLVFLCTAWQRSAHHTCFASPVKPTAISSSNLPSFTWMSQIIIKKQIKATISLHIYCNEHLSEQQFVFDWQKGFVFC